MKTPWKYGMIQINRVQVATLRPQLNNLKQGSKTFLDYFIEMKTLWNEVTSCRPIHACTCPYPCRCEAMRSTRHYILRIKSSSF